MSNEDKKSQPIFDAVRGEYDFYDFGDYLPQIIKACNGYGVSCRVPMRLHDKWISRVAGNRRFIAKVEEKIRSVLEPFLRNNEYYLKITWDNRGFSFQCSGDACDLYLEKCSGQYVPHNVDHSYQAIILFMAMSIFLPELYFVLSSLESGAFDLNNWPELPHEPFPYSILIDPLKAH